MPTHSRLRPAVIAAKQELTAARPQIERLHQTAAVVQDVCDRLTDLVDAVVLDLFHAALADLGEDGPRGLPGHLTLVACGGYGRGDVAPYSDVDLMLLYDPGYRARVVPLAKRLVADIFDAGLKLGHSVRTPAEACQLAWSDPTIFTAQAEARFLFGSVRLFTSFARRFRRGARRRFRALYGAVVKSREEERHKYGQTVYLLEPNIKESPGGLRDLQLLRWIAFARYGEAEPDALLQMGALTRADHLRLAEARQFLLRLRNEMHFHAGRPEDVLDRHEQLRIASLEGYPGAAGLLPVEQFMREYFHHTGEVRHTVEFFLSRTRPREMVRAMLNPVLGHRVEGDFYVGQRHIRATRRGLKKLRGNLAEVLRLMDLANLYGIYIDHDTWEAIRNEMMALPQAELTSEVIERFLSLLSQPKRLGELLRRLHELRVLEKLVPGMAHARCLLQFNEYHKYTVDEHSFRAVEAATDFLTDPRPVGDAYRSVRDKRTLHLALLIHDLGKGYAEHHSEVGARLADQAARMYGLPAHESANLQTLVREHLLMNQLAFRRDLNDETVLLQFAMDVGSPELLRMLYVHTCADLSAVGPGVMNEWKLGILTDLYQRTLQRLTGNAATPDAVQHADERRRQSLQLFDNDPDADWYGQQIERLPVTYLVEAAARQLATQLRQLRQLGRSEAIAWGRYLEDRRVVEYTVGTYEDAVPGIFHRLTGVLSSKGCSILSAQIHTLADQLVLDRFYVEDGDFEGAPPPQRLDEIRGKLVQAVERPTDNPPTFRQVWQSVQRRRQTQLASQPTRVQVDNTTSERATILDVFAHDRRGLLYVITRTLFELGLSVDVAKIGTFLDQVVDVFYVTDLAGAKIEDDERLEEIRLRLLTTIEELERS